LTIEDLRLYQRLYDFIIWVMPNLENIPKSYRFILGQRMGNILIDMLESFIVAGYSDEKAAPLRTADIGLEKFRVLFLMCKDLRFITPEQYAYGSEQLNIIGRLIGGWKKAEKGK
jgi:hypothetical protein